MTRAGSRTGCGASGRGTSRDGPRGDAEPRRAGAGRDGCPVRERARELAAVRRVVEQPAGPPAAGGWPRDVPRPVRRAGRGDGDKDRRVSRRMLLAAAPVVLVNVVAFSGQLAFLRDHLPWVPGGQVLMAVTLETIA